MYSFFCAQFAIAGAFNLADTQLYTWVFCIEHAWPSHPVAGHTAIRAEASR